MINEKNNFFGTKTKATMRGIIRGGVPPPPQFFTPYSGDLHDFTPVAGI